MSSRGRAQRTHLFFNPAQTSVYISEAMKLKCYRFWSRTPRGSRYPYPFNSNEIIQAVVEMFGLAKRIPYSLSPSSNCFAEPPRNLGWSPNLHLGVGCGS